MLNTAIPYEEVARRGREIYDRDVRPQLTEADRGKFIEINIETGEWVMDKSDVVAGRMSDERFGTNVRRFVHKVGYRTPYALGYPMSANTEPI